MHFDSIFIFVSVIAVGVACAYFLNKVSRSQTSTTIPLPVIRKDTLLTTNETNFFAALQLVVKQDVAIFAQVRIADIILVKRGTPRPLRRATFNRISQKHIDFLLCERSSTKILAAIEVDDRSHERIDRQKRDDLVNRVFEIAGIPLIRYPAAMAYRPRDILEALEPHLMEKLADRRDPSTARTTTRPATNTKHIRSVGPLKAPGGPSNREGKELLAKR